MGIAKDIADAIMEKIDYCRVLEVEPESDKHVCVYRNVCIDTLRIYIEIRLSDAAFKFSYANSQKMISHLETGWFSPVTNKKHFLKFFNRFTDEAMWLSKYKEE